MGNAINGNAPKSRPRSKAVREGSEVLVSKRRKRHSSQEQGCTLPTAALLNVHLSVSWLQTDVGTPTARVGGSTCGKQAASGTLQAANDNRRLG